MTKKALHTGRIINMLRTTLPFILAGTLATFPALAEDGFDFMGGNVAQVEKVAKAPREANGHSNGINLKEGAIAFGLGALGPLGAIGLPFVTVSAANRAAVEMNSFYSGTVVRGKVEKIDEESGKAKVAITGLKLWWGLDTITAPSLDTIDAQFDLLVLDFGGPKEAVRFAFVHKASGIHIGDIVDVKNALGVYAAQTKINKDLKLDFNKHMPRVIALYCKHDQPCQNDYESSLGVLYRHQDKEFPPSQYLIDPKIIQADQERMRHEAEEKTRTAASTWGESSLF